MNQQEPPKPAFGYVLVWYGKKHTRVRLSLRPGARQQLLMIRHYAKKNGFEIAGFESEYHRKAKAPRDFAVLFRLLDSTRPEQERPAVILDDITRLMKRLPSNQVDNLLGELSPWFEHIHDARLGRSLDQVDGGFWKHLCGIIGKQKLDTEVTRAASRRKTSAPPKQMRRAQKRATRERTRRADERAHQIAAVRNELLAGSPDTRLTFAAIARAANERGLKTSRGSDWTSVQVSRALQRLEKSGSV